MTDLSVDLRELYQDLILDHGKNPRHCHSLDTATHQAVGHNPLCGDKLVLFLSIDEAHIIQDVAFQGSGCAISTASASMLTEMLKGKSVAEAEKLFAYFHDLCTGATPSSEGLDPDAVDHLDALSGVRHYPMRVKCATLAWHTFQAALDNKKDISTE